MIDSGKPVIRRATAADIEDIVRVVTRAFESDDPIEDYVFPDPQVRRRRTPAMIRILLRYRYLPTDCAVVAEVDGAIVGALLWIVDGKSNSLWREAVSGPQLLWAMRGATRRGMEVDEAIARTSPKEPHNYMVYVAADPDAQRAGVGKAILAWITAESDAHGRALCGICKDENVGYYSRFGLDFVHRARIGGSGPEMNFLLRQPVPVSAR